MMINYIRAMMKPPMRPWFLTRLAIYIVSIAIGVDYGVGYGLVFLLVALAGYAFVYFFLLYERPDEKITETKDDIWQLKRYEEFLNRDMVLLL